MKKTLLITLFCAACLTSYGAHPSLLLTPDGVAKIRASRGHIPGFDRVVESAVARADDALLSPISVPVPKDGGGGPTHEKHKENYYSMFYCGIVYQLTGEARYADYVARMLKAYAALYPTLGYHPVKMSSTPGRLFWQTLNDYVWLVHTSVAYDCVREHIPAADRKLIEEKLFRPMAAFIIDGSQANNRTFNLMHNHGTWATAAVGMIGYAMDDQTLVDKALYGSDLSGKNGGYIQQLTELFSPDGYFTEGAYYQRYAIWPFVVFAQAIQNNQPSLGIFAMRDGIILKAVDTLLQMAYEGVFFLFNDALPKNYQAQELIFATDIAYGADTTRKQLLDVARRYQHNYLPTDAGYAVARDVHAGLEKPFILRSALLRDGPDGSRGGTAIMRSPAQGENTTLALKATAHGLSHGHYDKLTINYYDNGYPILVDYGASRFLNIEVKYNGNYTPLNKKWSMSTVAHNTVSVDMQDHYGGKIDVSSKFAPQIVCFDASEPGVQVASAVETNAFPGVEMRRTVAMIEDLGGRRVILDIFRLRSPQEHTYDLPYYYNGQMISLGAPYKKAEASMEAFGDKNGYRYLWKEAWGKAVGPHTCFTFLKGDRFYSVTTATDPSTELYFVRTGANDPEYYLRSEPGYIVRQTGVSNHIFLSAIETHGVYDLVIERTAEATSAVTELKVVEDNDSHTVVGIACGGAKATFRIDYDKPEGQKAWKLTKTE